MQIIFNPSEVESILAAHVNNYLSGDNISVIVNEDGSASISIDEEVSHEDNAPPVVEKKTRRRRSNPAEAKHVPVEAKKELEQPAETQTSTGGQNESSTQEAKQADQGEQTEPTEQLKEEATQKAEDAASDEVAEEAKAQEEAQEEKAAEAPAAKPSLFANLKR